MKTKQKLINNIKKLQREKERFEKLFDSQLAQTMPCFSTKELKEIEFEAEMDLYYMQEACDSICQESKVKKKNLKFETYKR